MENDAGLVSVTVIMQKEIEEARVRVGGDFHGGPCASVFCFQRLGSAGVELLEVFLREYILLSPDRVSIRSSSTYRRWSVLQNHKKIGHQ